MKTYEIYIIQAPLRSGTAQGAAAVMNADTAPESYIAVGLVVAAALWFVFTIALMARHWRERRRSLRRIDNMLAIMQRMPDIGKTEFERQNDELFGRN